MTKKNQTGNLTNEIFTGESGVTWINEIYGDTKNLKGNAIGGNDAITGGNDGATNHLYGDAHSLKENAKGGVDTITGGSNGATNYIYGDAYSMKGKVQGGNDILIGGLNAKNFIYGDAFAMSNGAKAGDDAISMANTLSLSLAAINASVVNGSTQDFSQPITSATIQNNALIGDSDSVINSSSGADSINIGNNSSIDIKEVNLQSLFGSNINASSNVGLDISKNVLIGDAKSLKNSSSGNDNVAVGHNIISNVGKTILFSFGNSKVSASSTVDINLSSNRLIGDAENITSSSAGYDSLSVGDNLGSTVEDVSVTSASSGTAVNSILLNFKFLDNILFGDAKNMKRSSAADDAISVGNNIKNTSGDFNINVTGDNIVSNSSAPIISSNESADFIFSRNELIGDAASLESSSAGKDSIGIGNDFQNSLGSIKSSASGIFSFNVSESISYKVNNNLLIGDTKNMVHSSSGADTIGVGNNLKNSIGEIILIPTGSGEARILASTSYSLSENSLIGDALSLKNSSASDDILKVGNNFSNDFQKISNTVANGKSSVVSLDSNFTISNNSLMGDADNMRNSSSGDDDITVGNAFNAAIGAIKNSASSVYSLAETTVLSRYIVSDNRLIGDAKTMQDSSGGNDKFTVANDINTSVSSITNSANAQASIQSNMSLNFSFIDNILLGDAESMKKSSGGHDIIQLGNNFKNKSGDVIGTSYNASSLQSSLITKFSLSDNALYGDAKIMDHASGGDDQIIVGNSFRGEIGNINNTVGDNSSLSVKLESSFSLLNNTLIGDAKTMSHSQGGNDVISLGNDLVNSVGTLNSTVYNNSTDTTTVSIIYTLDNNNLYGDAETMSYSKGGNDTLSIGVGIEGDSSLILDIKNNTLYGDANTMKRSQGGDDKLTAADGEGSVTYLYGDAKFTDGKSGAGNDTLISGHGNDHMWGDFGANLNQNVPYVNYSTGKDIFVFGENNGNDIIYDFQRGLDKIDFRSLGGIDSINDFTITSNLAQPSNSVIDFGNGNSITLIGVSELSANDFMFAAVV